MLRNNGVIRIKIFELVCNNNCKRSISVSSLTIEQQVKHLHKTVPNEMSQILHAFNETTGHEVNSYAPNVFDQI